METFGDGGCFGQHLQTDPAASDDGFGNIWRRSWRHQTMVLATFGDRRGNSGGCGSDEGNGQFSLVETQATGPGSASAAVRYTGDGVCVRAAEVDAWGAWGTAGM